MKSIGGKGVLALSLVLGIATSYMVYNYVDQASKAAKPVPTVAVVTAAKDIPARTAITGDMLRLAQVPVSVKIPQAISTPDLVAGKVSKLPIAQGEQVLGSQLYGDREQSGLAFVVPNGLRAVAVGVDEVVSPGGMIVPGDSVDVIAVVDTDPAATNGTQSPSPNQARVKAMAQYVLQNVEVLGVAQQLEGDPPPANVAQKAVGAAASNGQQPQQQKNVTQPAAKTVTLAVAPQDAEKLVLAEDKGHIRLVLRAHGDTGTVKLTDEGLFTTIGSAAALKSEAKPL